MTDFKAGEKARTSITNSVVEIVSGPHKTVGEKDSYLAKFENGNHLLASVTALKPIPPVDPRVEIAAKAQYRMNGGDDRDWDDVESQYVRDSYLRDAAAVIKALDAMAPVVPAEPVRYRDSENCVWEVRPSGLLDLVEYEDGYPTRGDTSFKDYDFQLVKEKWGPLRRVDVVPLKPGDKIRILKDKLDAADVRAGDVLTVDSVRESYFTTDAPRLPHVMTWSFMHEDEGAGWERA